MNIGTIKYTYNNLYNKRQLPVQILYVPITQCPNQVIYKTLIMTARSIEGVKPHTFSRQEGKTADKE